MHAFARAHVAVHPQLLSHIQEQTLKHERMVELQNRIMSENARLHGSVQVAGDNLERAGHLSRDLEFANQMVREENQRCVCAVFLVLQLSSYSFIARAPLKSMSTVNPGCSF